jgi:signal transduction histidine kinase
LKALLEDEVRLGIGTDRPPNDVLGPAHDAAAAAAAAAGLIHEALGEDAAIVVSQPDGAGRLRVLWRSGITPDVGRVRYVRRRAAFETARASRVPLQAPRGHALGLLPLACEGRVLGVLEIVASEPAMRAAWTTLEATAGTLAVTLRSMGEQEQLLREVETLERTSRLGTELVRARTPEAALGIAVRFVAERDPVPIAGWSSTGFGGMRLTAVRGMGAAKRRELQLAMAEMSPWGSLDPSERATIERRFEQVVGARGVASYDAGEAVILAVDPTRQIDATLELVGRQLADVLRLLGPASLAERRSEQLNMGIAWTAHELRGPLLGVRAVLELLGRRRDADPRERAVLDRSVYELDQLVGLSESLLAWAAGARPLRRKPTDLVRIVEDAAETCRMETGTDGVAVLAPAHAMAELDGGHVRAAVVNLIRNALAFANRGTQVEVRVQDAGDQLMLSVRDEGPPIPEAERAAIFDPFVRGQHAHGRNGSGLGLYIARRIVEAHDGKIWVESDEVGPTFHVALPVEGRESRFAS